MKKNASDIKVNFLLIAEIVSKCSGDVITDSAEDHTKNKFFNSELLEVLVLVAEV